jgi:tetratricopeptide (TPR) repeat protein
VKALENTENNALVHLMEKTSIPLNEEDYEEEHLLVHAYERFSIDRITLKLVKQSNETWFDMCPPTKGFTGRDESLKNLDISIRSQKKCVDKGVSKMTTICGLGGIGKTEIARMYAYSHFRDGNVVWINSETYFTMLDSFKRLALISLNLKIITVSNNEHEYSKEVLDKVYTYFSGKKTLFIFDNAENSSEEWNDGITRFLPKQRPGVKSPFVLVTSRNTRWSSATIEWDLIHVEAFTPKESIEYITSQLANKDEGSASITRLSNKLKGLPLALQQAVGYINEKRISSDLLGETFGVADYTKVFCSKFEELMNFNPFGNAAKDPSVSVTYVTWRISVNRIVEDDHFGFTALRLLYVSAYFNSENIDTLLFKSLSGFERQSQLVGSIKLLRKYALVSVISGKMRIHGLVQTVTRAAISTTSGLQEAALADGIRILAEHMPDSTEEILTSKILFSHSVSAWDYAVLIPDLVQKYNQFLVMTTMHLWFSGSLTKAKKLTDLGKASLKSHPLSNEQVLQTEFAGAIQSFLNNDSQTALSKVQAIYQEVQKQPKAGEPTQAENIGQDFLANLQKAKTPADQRNMAIDYFKSLSCVQGEPDDAELFSAATIGKLISSVFEQEGSSALFEMLAGGVAASVGTENVLVRTLKQLQAGSLSQSGKRDEALEMFEAVRISEEDEKGAEHIDYAEEEEANPLQWEMRRLHASALAGSDQPDKGLEMLRRLEREIQRQSPDSSDVFAVRVDIVTVLMKMNRSNEALDILESVCAASSNILGTNSGARMGATTALVNVYGQLNRYEESLSAAQIVYEHLFNFYGPDDQNTVSMAIAISGLVDERDAGQNHSFTEDEIKSSKSN